ncbi:MAG: hypothetical protein ACRYGR_05410 [Janthinobacterium lividum]
MEYFASIFYHRRLAIKSTLFFCFSFIILAQCQTSGLPSELEEKILFNAHKVLNEACENQVAPQIFTDYTLKEDRNKTLEEANKAWLKIVNYLEILKDDSLNQELDFLANYLYSLDLANNHFLNQQKKELEEKQELSSDRLIIDFLEPSVLTKSKTIIDVDEDNQSQNHGAKENMKVQKTTLWKNFYFFFREYLFSPFKTKYNNFRK